MRDPGRISLGYSSSAREVELGGWSEQNRGYPRLRSYFSCHIPETFHHRLSQTLPISQCKAVRLLKRVQVWLELTGAATLSDGQKLAKAMSLYNHVTNKNDLIDAMVDQVIREIQFPVPALDWKMAMGQRALSAHQVLLRHAWATMPIVSRLNVGPAMLRCVDATLGCLREAGFSLEMADHAWNAMDSYIYGFTLQELNLPIQASDYAQMAKGFIDRIPSEQYPYLNQLVQLIIERKYDGLHNFEFVLDLLLNGLEGLRDTH